MTILVVDNNLQRLQELTGYLQTVFPDETIISHIDPLMAGKYSFSHRVDLLFAEIRMKRMDGPQMGEFVQRTHPSARVYLIGGREEVKTCAEQNLDGVDGLLTRPVTIDALRHVALDHACCSSRQNSKGQGARDVG